MDENRWREVRRIFETAVELPPEQREAYLDDVCADDQELRRRVSSLLAADQVPRSLLDRSAFEVLVPAEDARGALSESGAKVLPGMIGAYRVLDEVGRGGMGVVYRAERADGTFDRAVAIKLVRGGFDSPEIAARFRAEQRILANLEHPNVARLYDAGLTDDGRPYLVMELVDGDPIDRHCDEARLDVRQRIRLVREVCEAVQYAHRNLVIHRDLKPSNILVDRKGAVRLLDFGVAKLAEPELGEAPETGTGPRPLTPEYASPEQIRGDPLTTASDVYSLGVVLYELLTGRRPFEGWIRSVAHALGAEPLGRPAGSLATTVTIPSRAVTEATEIAGPDGVEVAVSPLEVGRRRRTTVERLRRTLRGDLDRIVLKTLAHDPLRRYASVEALAEDLDRYLLGLPVRAQAPSVLYRARKFVARHRGGVAAAVAVLLALATAGVVVARESRVATAEREVALGVSAFLEDLFAASDPRRLGVQDTTRMLDFLDASASRVDEELAGQPRTHARMLLVLGRTFYNIGRTDRAETLLGRAIEAQRAIYGERHEDVAETRRLLGMLLSDQDRFDAAISQLEAALTTQRALSGEQSWQVARLHEALGQALMNAGEPERAVPHVEAALRIRREVLEPDDPVIANSINTLAALTSRLGDDRAAVSLFEEAIDASLLSRDAVPEDIGVQRMNLAMIYMRIARFEDALEQARQGHEILASNERPWVVARSRARLAQALVRVWSETEADALAVEADSLFRSGIELMKSLPEAPQVRYLLHPYAQFLQQRGDPDGAELAMREALEVSAATMGSDHPESQGLRSNVAAILLARGRPAEAEPLAAEAHATLASAMPVGHPTRTFATTTWARILLALGRPDEAVAILEPEHEATAAALGKDHSLVEAQGRTLADAFAALGRTDDANRRRR